MFNMVIGKHVALLGVVFKNDTSDIRETATVFIAWGLLTERADTHIYDPEVVHRDMFKEINYSCGTNVAKTPHLEECNALDTCP